LLCLLSPYFLGSNRPYYDLGVTPVPQYALVQDDNNVEVLRLDKVRKSVPRLMITIRVSFVRDNEILNAVLDALYRRAGVERVNVVNGPTVYDKHYENVVITLGEASTPKKDLDSYLSRRIQEFLTTAEEVTKNVLARQKAMRAMHPSAVSSFSGLHLVANEGSSE